MWICLEFVFFFFNDTATTEIYTLSLHDALPIYLAFFFLGEQRGRVVTKPQRQQAAPQHWVYAYQIEPPQPDADRKSTRLNSSHGYISYAVFCLKKKKTARTR